MVYEYIFSTYWLLDSFVICVQSKMDKSSCIGQRLSLSPIFLILSLLSATGSSQQLPRAATPCLPNNPKCYFERFANFKIPQLEPLKVGHVRKLKLVDGKEHQMVTTAVHPPIFEIADFLSDEECDHIIKLAKDEGLETSRTMKEGIKYDTRALGKNTKKYFDIWDLNDDAHIDKDEMVRNLENYLDFTPDEATLLNMYSTLQLDKDQDENISFEEFKERDIAEMAKLITRVKIEKPQTKSRHSEQAWIENVSGRSDGIITAIAERVQRLTMLPMEVIKASEYIQVVSYGPTGHYNCHLDSDNIRPNKPCCHILDSDNHCRMCRFATVLYFLDNVEEGGETAFPVADNITFDNNEWIRDSENVCNLAKNCHKANVVVKPEKGKAVLWYNHRIDNATGWLGELDKYSFHGGCNVRRGTKWIANHWISLSEDKEEDIKNWIELDQYEEDEKQVRESNKDISHQEL